MGKELVLKVLNHEHVDEVPWVPFAGVHAGYLKGYTAKEILTDADKLYDALMEVHKLYTPDGMPIMFDLQIEAEILGCKMMWNDDNPPSVASHPFADETVDPKTLPIPKATDGRLPLALDVMKRMKKSVGDDTALYGLICGPLTLASHLRGSEFFMDMYDEPEYVEALMDYCANVNIAIAKYYIDAGMDVIAVVDPLVSQVSADIFDEQLGAAFKKVFDYVREQGVKSSFFVCGNASSQIDVMCQTGPDCISVDENVDLLTAQKTTAKYNITIAGNIPLTTTMLFGNQQDNRKWIVEFLDKMDHYNLIVSPGCDMPYKTPAENTIAAVYAIKHTEEAREMIAGYEGAAMDDIDIELPDYANLTKPLVEVCTLDPVQCAACTYMVAVCEQIKKDFGDTIDMAIYRYCIKEDIARMSKMGVKNLPSLYINGDLKWDCQIPSREQLTEEIKKYL